MKLTVLGAADIRECVDMPTAIDLMAEAFTALSDRKATVPVRGRMDLSRGVTLLMPAHVPGGSPGPEDGDKGGALGLKIVTVFPGNRDIGLPAIHALIVAIDPVTGVPAAVMDGTFVTALRTGAASGLATRLLAREDARVLTIFGAGAQARSQIEAVRAVRPIEEVRVVSQTRASAEALADDLEGVRAIALPDPASALDGADVVVAATNSSSPVFHGQDVAPGTHVNGVGSYTADMTEVDVDLVQRSYVVVDSREAAMEEAGDLIQPILSGVIDESHLKAEIGEVALGRRPGRENDDQVTFFKSVGVAVQDLAVVGHVLTRARELGLGTQVEM